MIALLFVLDLPRYYVSRVIEPIYEPLIRVEKFVSGILLMEDMLDFAFRSVPFSRVVFVNEPVFNRPVSPSSITIPFGSSAGVSYGDPLVVFNCLVGKVVKVSDNSSLAHTIYNEQFVIPVMDYRSGFLAMVYGGDEPFLEYLEGMDIEKGDTLMTSGVEGLFPSGLLVGVVDSVISRNRGFVRRVVKPLCPVHRLMRFHIVRRSE